MASFKLAKTSLVTKAKDFAPVVDAYKKADELKAVNATTELPSTAVSNALNTAVNSLKGAAKDKKLQSLVKDAVRGKVDKDVALDRLKDVVGASVLKSVGDPKDLKKKLMGGLLKGAGLNVDRKGLLSKLKVADSLKGKMGDIGSMSDKYPSFGISFNGQTRCSNMSGKGLLDMLNGALGKNKFKEIDFDLKFKSLSKLFDNLPDFGIDDMFEEMMDVFEPGEELVSFLAKGLKGALKKANFSFLKKAGDVLGGEKLLSEFPDFATEFLKKFKQKMPKCEIETTDTARQKVLKIKELMEKAGGPRWNKYTRDDSLGTGKGDGTGGTGQAVVVSNLAPFTKMSEDAKKLLRTDPDPDMQLDLLIAEEYKSQRLTFLAKMNYPNISFA